MSERLHPVLPRCLLAPSLRRSTATLAHRHEAHGEWGEATASGTLVVISQAKGSWLSSWHAGSANATKLIKSTQPLWAGRSASCVNLSSAIKALVGCLEEKVSTTSLSSLGLSSVSARSARGGPSSGESPRRLCSRPFFFLGLARRCFEELAAHVLAPWVEIHLSSSRVSKATKVFLLRRRSTRRQETQLPVRHCRLLARG